MHKWFLVCYLLGWESGVDERSASGAVYQHGDGAGMYVPSGDQLHSNPAVAEPITCPFGKERYCA